MARYIDADKLSSKVLDVWKKFEKQGKNCYVFADIFVPLIVSTPTEDVAPIIRGKWIVKTDNENKTCGECSVCGKIQYAGELNYCPYCGAKMEESGETQ